MNHDTYPEDYIRNILKRTKTVAIVGASANVVRPSYFVLKYLLDKDYDVTPVNPGLAGKKLLGQETYATLTDIPHPIDMVEIFRNSAAAGPIVDEALTLDPLPETIWMQLMVRNDEAAKKAEAAGIDVVMDRCPKIEYARLSGEIGWAGVNSRTISSRRPFVRPGYQHLDLKGE